MCKLHSLLSSNHIRLLRSHADEVDSYDAYMGSTKTGVGVEPSSACLWAMVNDFLEVDCTSAATACEDQITSRAPGVFLRNTSGGMASSSDITIERAIQEMESIFGESSALQGAVEAKIGSCVMKALKSKSNITTGVESANNEQALSAVLKYLQREGYDAGLCVTARKPGIAAGIPRTGGHRYIDVILEEKPISRTLQLNIGKRPSDRLIVDVGFRAHFEIARSLPAYQNLIAILPSTFIGKSALLQRVVRIMSQAARASLESQGMPIPPWRTFSILLAKWLSPCSSRITSVDKAKHVVNNASSAGDRIKPHILAELDSNTGLANLANSPASDENCEKQRSKLSFFSEEDVVKAWYPPPPTAASQIPNSCIIDNNDITSSSYKRRRPRQASVVSALALALAETQLSTHNMGVACYRMKEGCRHN